MGMRTKITIKIVEK